MPLLNRSLVHCGLCLGAILAAAPNPLHAGGWLGRKLADSVQPTLETFWGGANDLADNLDQKLAAQLDRADSITGKLVAQSDKNLADRIDQVDRSLAARILQIDTATSRLVKDSLGELDEVSRQRIDQLGSEVKGAIQMLDASAVQLLDRTDAILAERIDQLNGLTTNAIRQADRVLESRILQIDETVGRRLGNVDVIVTKQRLGLEHSLVRVAFVLAVCAFVVLALRRVWQTWSRVWPALRARAFDSRTKLRMVAREFVPQVAAIAAAAAIGLGLLFVLYERLPQGASNRLAEVVTHHEKSYRDSLASLDFTRARFHAAQLELLVPEASSLHRARASKADLFRLVFARPTALATPEGTVEIKAQIKVVEQHLGARPDPDVLTIQAYVVWQLGTTRGDEHTAASLCARALRLDPQGSFALAPLAASYIRSFLHAPYVPPGVALSRDSESLSTMRRFAGRPALLPPHFPLAQIVQYNALARRLDRASTAAFLAMLRAHADFTAESKGTRGTDSAPAAASAARRLAAARDVVAAWREFDADFRSSAELGDSLAALALFSLNDAVVTHALWFVENPDTLELLPALNDIASPPLRAKLAPPRIAWSRRYAAILGARAREVLDFQEAERYAVLDDQTRTFARAYVLALAAQKAGASTPRAEALRRRAALSAARLGLYVDIAPGQRRALGEHLLLGRDTPTDRPGEPAPADELAHVRAALAQRGLRFL